MLHVDDVTALPGPGLIVSDATLDAKHDAVAGVRPGDAPGDETRSSPTRRRASTPRSPRCRSSARTGDPGRRSSRRRSTCGSRRDPRDRRLGAIDRDGWQDVDRLHDGARGLVPNPVTVDELVVRGVPAGVLRRRARLSSGHAQPPRSRIGRRSPSAPGSLSPLDARRDARTRRTGSSRSTRPAGWRSSAASPTRRPTRSDGALDLRPRVVLPGLVDTHAHLPQLPERRARVRARPADLARPADVPDGAIVGRPRRGRAAGAGDLPGVRRGRDDDRPRLRRRLRGGDGRRVPGRRGARDPGDPRQGDDGSAHVRPDDRAVDDPRPDAARVGRPRSSGGTARPTGGCGYAVTPRFAVSCTADLLRESAALARSTGTWWQSHVSEDPGEIAEVARLFPEALDYLDVYDRAGGAGAAFRAGPRDPPLRPRELARLVETGHARRRTARRRTCSSGPG